MLDHVGLRPLLRDFRVRRLLVANTLGAIGSGVTIFSVPWLMVHRAGGAEAFRWITVGTTLVLFVLMPYFGAWVDRHSRKTALLTSEAWGLLATTAMAATGLALGGFAMWQLMAVYFAGMLYYTLHYPAKFALIQQMFDRSQYQSLTGLLEIQGQTAMMIAGGLGGWLVEHVSLSTILFFDAATYLASFLILATLPYRATHLTDGNRQPGRPPAGNPLVRAPSVWSGVAAGWHWLRERPQLNIFLTCSFVPFIVVMAANYLFPIYVMDTLRASAAWFAAGEIAFAIGAILAGALLPRLIARHTASTTIPVTMAVFIAGIAMVLLLHFPLTYLCAGLLLGVGNAGCRVARSALLLNIVPNEVMGRVGGFYQVFDRVLRTVLVLSMVVIDRAGPPAGFMILLAVLLLAFLGVMQTRRALRAVETSASPA